MLNTQVTTVNHARTVDTTHQELHVGGADVEAKWPTILYTFTLTVVDFFFHGHRLGPSLGIATPPLPFLSPPPPQSQPRGPNALS